MKKLLTLIVVIAFGLMAGSAHAGENIVWDGGGTDNLWTTPQNWVDDSVPGTDDNAHFSDSSAPAALVDDTVNASVAEVLIAIEASDGTCTLNVTGGSLTATDSYFMVGKSEGEGIMNMSGGSVLAAEGFIIANSDSGNGSFGTLNMSGGTITVRGTNAASTWYRNFTIADQGEAILNMSGGVINAEDNMYLSRYYGKGVVNMTGGTINVTGNITLSLQYRNRPSEFYLHGGTVNADDLVIAGTGGILDILDGVMILNGDKLATIQSYLDNNSIVAYGTPDAVLVDYNVTNPGKTTISRDVNYNCPPEVDAGDYQEIVWQAPSVTVQLDATVSDDGNPVPPAITFAWSKFKGPGAVSFTPADNIEDPCATFTVPGMYELQLSATDGEKSNSDVVKIYIRSDWDPIARWNFEEGQDTTVGDSSANNNVGTFGGNIEPNWVGTGWVGSDSLEFYRSSYVEIDTDDNADPNLDNLSSKITVAAWFKTTDLQKWETIASKAGTSCWRLRRNSSSHNLNFGISGVANISGTRNIDDGHWHHVAGVYDGSTLSIYTDGVLDVSVEASGNFPTGASPVWIGGRSDNPGGRGWKGLLDDVRVYDYGLSADQVETLAAMAPLIPMVDAGEDLEFSIQDAYLQLDGTVIDDGKPAVATIEWTSDPCNPGTVTFLPSADIEDPCVTFSEAGEYVLRLTANDTMATISDEVTITVASPTCQDVIDAGLLLTGDFSGPEGTPDCHVDLYDFAAFASNWLRCNNPQDTDCEFPF